MLRVAVGGLVSDTVAMECVRGVGRVAVTILHFWFCGCALCESVFQAQVEISRAAYYWQLSKREKKIYAKNPHAYFYAHKTYQAIDKFFNAK